MMAPAPAPATAPRRTVSKAPLTTGSSRRWILFVSIVISLVPLLVSLENLLLSSEVSPLLAASSAVVWALYTIPFLIIIRRIDFFEREPWISLVAAFLWGGFIAGGMALMANDAIFDLVTVQGGVVAAQDWGAAIAGPTTEELAKGLGVLLILMASPRRPRTALDGFVIGAVVGLGFQVIENFGYTMNTSAIEDDPSLAPLAQMFVIRGLIAGPFSHAVYTGIVGLGIGYLVTATDRSMLRRIGVALLAFIGAYAAHWFWNSPLLINQVSFLGSVLVKGAFTFGILIVGLRIARRRDAAFFSEGLSGVPDWLCSPAEQQSLSTGKGRKRARTAAKRAGGRPARRAMASLQRAQADLAVAVRVGDQQAADNAVERIRAARAVVPLPTAAPSPPEPVPPTTTQPPPITQPPATEPDAWEPPTGPPVL